VSFLRDAVVLKESNLGNVHLRDKFHHSCIDECPPVWREGQRKKLLKMNSGITYEQKPLLRAITSIYGIPVTLTVRCGIVSQRFAGSVQKPALFQACDPFAVGQGLIGPTVIFSG
jgi:hypothetical protein